MTREEQIKEAAYEAKAKHIGYGDSVVYAFIDGAIWADSHPHWISVDDELPKENGRYLFYHTITGVQSAYYYNDLTLDKAVTHWMPLPAPPSESVTTCNHKTSSSSEIPTNLKGGEQ